MSAYAARICECNVHQVTKVHVTTFVLQLFKNRIHMLLVFGGE